MSAGGDLGASVSSAQDLSGRVPACFGSAAVAPAAGPATSSGSKSARPRVNRAAPEASLSVADAEEMLTKLISGGPLMVRARDGHLAHALHVADRRDVRPKELDGAEGSVRDPVTPAGDIATWHAKRPP